MSTAHALLDGDRSRFVLFPIQYPELWDAYKAAQQSIWMAEEVDLAVDREHWENRLASEERHFVSTILAFFAGSDGLVVENLAQRFCGEIEIPEARCFYGIQMMMENVHAEVYSRLIQELVTDINVQRGLFGALTDMPEVRAKADWCLKWVDATDKDLSVRLVAFAIVEGVFFSSSFAAVFWIRQKGLMPGLVQANAMIARDEGLHVRFACMLYATLQMPVDAPTVRVMLSEAVGLEKAFFEAALPTPLVGINSRLMSDYVEYVADYLLVLLGHAPAYHTSNPFPFIDTISIGTRANFFERPSSDYLGAPPPRLEPTCDGTAIRVGEERVDCTVNGIHCDRSDADEQGSGSPSGTRVGTPVGPPLAGSPVGQPDELLYDVNDNVIGDLITDSEGNTVHTVDTPFL